MNPKESKDHLYQCVSCKKLWNHDQIRVKEVSLYGKKIEEKTCPFCNKRVVYHKDHRFVVNK